MAALPALAVGCVFLACLLLSYAYEHTFHVLLSHVAQVFIDATWNGPFGISIGFAFIGHALNSLDNLIRNGLYAGLHGTEWAWHQLVHQLAVMFHDIAHTVEQVSLGTEQALRYLRHTVLPFTIRAVTDPIGTTARLALQLVRDLQAEVAGLSRPVTKVITHDVPHALTKAEQAAIAAQVAVPAAITKVIEVPAAGIDYVGREAGALRQRLDALARRISPAALAGIVAASVLSTLGLGWLKCSNVGRVGRRVCGLDARVLDALLAGLAVFVTVDIVRFAHEVQGVTHEFAGAVRGFWRVSQRPGPGGDRQLGQTRG